VIDVRRSPELQAAILACKRVDGDLRKAIYAASRQSVNALWVPALGRRARTLRAQRVIVKGARAAIRTDGFTLHAATSRRALSGGLVPATEWQGDEFGARTRKATFTQRSRLGKSYRVSKTVNRQFPGRTKDGRIAFDAASEVGTKTVAAWVQAVVTTIVNATGGERA
jgi:hypothetical protein